MTIQGDPQHAGEKSVLVTGASGFTGSNLVRSLAGDGVQVRALVRPTSKVEGLNGPNVKFVTCDLADGAIPEEAVKGVDTVYHVAAVYRTQGVPDSYFHSVHVKATEDLLKKSLEAGVRRFIHVSTVGVLGKILNPPADENAPFGPADVYQRTKLEGELLAMDFFHKYGLPGTVIRPTGIYGPGDMRFLKLFRSIDKGLFWMIGSGEVLYHFTYIDDLVEGMKLAARRDEAVGEVFIIGGDETVTISNLVDMIAEVLGKRVSKRKVPVGPVMLAARLCEGVCRPLGINPPLYPRRLDFFIKDRSFDISKARKLLGYEPRVDLKTGLACTSEWYREQKLI
jgi:nucleoside-diphosphate-sugar epimerase